MHLASILSCWAALAAGLIPAASANDAAFRGSGGSVTSAAEPRVRMLSERILIEPSRQPGAPRFTAVCTFVFRNSTREPVGVLMGFPDTFEAETIDDRRVDAGFRAWVRGREVEPAHGPVDWDERAASGPDLLRYGHAWTWPVSFAPGEQVVVRNTYRFGGLTSNGPAAACADWTGAAAASAWWEALAPGPCNAFADGTCEAVPYVVTTGLTWGGSIGRAEIVIRLPPGWLPSSLVPHPAASRMTASEVAWRFEDWTPSGQVALVHARPPWRHEPDSECPRGRDGPSIPFHSAGQARAWLQWAKGNGATRSAVRAVREAVEAAAPLTAEERLIAGELRAFERAAR